MSPNADRRLDPPLKSDVDPRQDRSLSIGVFGPAVYLLGFGALYLAITWSSDSSRSLADFLSALARVWLLGVPVLSLLGIAFGITSVRRRGINTPTAAGLVLNSAWLVWWAALLWMALRGLNL